MTESYKRLQGKQKKVIILLRDRPVTERITVIRRHMASKYTPVSILVLFKNIKKHCVEKKSPFF